MAALLALKFLPELWKLYSFTSDISDLAPDAPIETEAGRPSVQLAACKTLASTERGNAAV
jgi:hypothetical protein